MTTLLAETLKVVPEKFSKQTDLSILNQTTQAFAFEKDAKYLPDKRTIAMSEKFKMIDLDFLKSRHKTFPKFSVFTLNSKICQIGSKVEGSEAKTSFICNFNSLIVKQKYADIFARLADNAYKIKISGDFMSSWVAMTCEFNGVIPDESRGIITKEAQNFDEILIVAEASKWKMENFSVPIPYTRDPLVIGIIGIYAFLIHQFDVTPMEDYVFKEFIK